jgi:hypothetical protein
MRWPGRTFHGGRRGHSVGSGRIGVAFNALGDRVCSPCPPDRRRLGVAVGGEAGEASRCWPSTLVEALHHDRRAIGVEYETRAQGATDRAFGQHPDRRHRSARGLRVSRGERAAGPEDQTARATTSPGLALRQAELAGSAETAPVGRLGLISAGARTARDRYRDVPARVMLRPVRRNRRRASPSPAGTQQRVGDQVGCGDLCSVGLPG